MSVSKDKMSGATDKMSCHHLDGTISLVMNKPEKGVGPKIVFTNNPKIRKSR